MFTLTTYAILTFATSLALVLALTPLGIRLAGVFGLVDEPGVRKVHQTPIPRIGGVAIAFASIVSFLVFGGLYVSRHSVPLPFNTALTLLAAGTCVFLL